MVQFCWPIWQLHYAHYNNDLCSIHSIPTNDKVKIQNLFAILWFFHSLALTLFIFRWPGANSHTHTDTATDTRVIAENTSHNPPTHVHAHVIFLSRVHHAPLAIASPILKPPEFPEVQDTHTHSHAHQNLWMSQIQFIAKKNYSHTNHTNKLSTLCACACRSNTSELQHC